MDHKSPTSQKLAAVFLFGLAFIVYLPSIGNGFIWDDDAYVQHNPTLRSAAGLPSAEQARQLWHSLQADVWSRA